jgi:hypothetical protein
MQYQHNNLILSLKFLSLILYSVGIFLAMDIFGKMHILGSILKQIDPKIYTNIHWAIQNAPVKGLNFATNKKDKLGDKHGT